MDYFLQRLKREAQTNFEAKIKYLQARFRTNPKFINNIITATFLGDEASSIVLHQIIPFDINEQFVYPHNLKSFPEISIVKAAYGIVEHILPYLEWNPNQFNFWESRLFIPNSTLAWTAFFNDNDLLVPINMYQYTANLPYKEDSVPVKTYVEDALSIVEDFLVGNTKAIEKAKDFEIPFYIRFGQLFSRFDFVHRLLFLTYGNFYPFEFVDLVNVVCNIAKRYVPNWDGEDPKELEELRQDNYENEIEWQKQFLINLLLFD